MTLSENLLKEHYANIAALPFFTERLVFMRSRSVIVIALRGKNIIGKARFVWANGFYSCLKGYNSWRLGNE
jgi:nucleoside diphosphate kinase